MLILAWGDKVTGILFGAANSFAALASGPFPGGPTFRRRIKSLNQTCLTDMKLVGPSLGTVAHLRICQNATANGIGKVKVNGSK